MSIAVPPPSPAPRPAPEALGGPTPAASKARTWITRFLHDLLFVGAGWAISATVGGFLASMFFGAVFLVPMALVGVLFLPVTLILAGYSADLSRLRYNLWTGEGRLPLLTRKPTFDSLASYLRTCLDLRLWLDLVFEMLVAGTWRTLTAGILFTWLGVGVFFALAWVPLVFGVNAGETLSYALFREFAGKPGPESVSHLVWILGDTVGFGLVGLAILAAWPWGLRIFARIEGWLTRSTLSGREFASMRLEGWAFSVAMHVALLTSLVMVVAGTGYIADPTGSVPLALAAVLAMSLGLLLAIRWPLLGTLLSTGTFLVTSVQALVATGARMDGYEGASWPLTLPASILFAFLLLFVSAKRHTQVALAGFGILLATSVGSLISRLLVIDKPSILLGPFILLVVSILGWLAALAGGYGVRALADSARSASADRAAREAAEASRAQAEIARVRAEHESERSRLRSSQLDERARIAREMHDVVAHSMSLISVQAQSAPYRLVGSDLDDATRAEFAQIAATSRTALGEMRGLLTVLRGSDSDHDAEPRPFDQAPARAGQASAPNTTPQPTVTDIPTLVEGAKRAGASVTFHADDALECSSIPATMGLTLYRAAQEGISNALRHAPGAPITISLSETGPGLALTVRNEHTEAPSLKAPGSGYGLQGVRERAGALGGSVEAGPEADGGFALTVTLPHGHR